MSDTVDTILMKISNLATGDLPKKYTDNGHNIWDAFRLGEAHAKLATVNSPKTNTMLYQIERKIESARQLGKKVKRIHITEEVHKQLKEDLHELCMLITDHKYNTKQTYASATLNGYRLKVHNQCLDKDWWLEFESEPWVCPDCDAQVGSNDPGYKIPCLWKAII